MSNYMPRMRQSYAKTLLTNSPAHLKRQLDGDQKTTRAMNRGSLFDDLVFGRTDRIKVVTAPYASGPRKGLPAEDWTSKAAQEERDGILRDGGIPALQHEVDALDGLVCLARERLAKLAGEDSVFGQRTVQWISDLGLACEGTPDWILVSVDNVVRTVDLKRTDPDPRSVERQLASMCWHVQAAAYQEAAMSFARTTGLGEPKTPYVYGGHTILACADDDLTLVLAHQLGPVALEVGRRRWEAAQKMWVLCWQTGEWPAYQERELEPPRYEVISVLEKEPDFKQEESEP